MKYYTRILFINAWILLAACSTKTDKQVVEFGNSKMLDSIALATNQPHQNKSIIEDDITCIRRQAEPVVKKNYFLATTFVLQPDSLTGVETVSMRNGDKLIITNWGCESYVLTFRFETAKFKANASQLRYWYIVAGKLMNEVLPGIDAPLDIKEGVRALNHYAAKNAKRLRLQSEINFSGDEAVRIVTLDSIARTQNNRTAVTISFTAGL